jgi:hypothetical protein
MAGHCVSGSSANFTAQFAFSSGGISCARLTQKLRRAESNGRPSFKAQQSAQSGYQGGKSGINNLGRYQPCRPANIGKKFAIRPRAHDHAIIYLLKEPNMNHYTVKALGLLALLFLVSAPIKAQTHACGGARAGNEVQVGEAPGGNGVAPTPLCDWVNSNQPQRSQPLPPPPQWATRWGAMATDGPGGHLGSVVGLSSKADAQRAAIADCQAKGGTHCAIEVAYDNECAAMVLGDNLHNITADVTLDRAIQSSMKSCSASDTNCHVYYTACSLPQRIQ